ncbi:MAG: rod shape-determining protein [Bacteroidales bacterium]|nr:rod shape-determining protein [Bacteroidales bacterium]
MKNGIVLLDDSSIVAYRETHDENVRHCFCAGIECYSYDDPEEVKYLYPVKEGILADFDAVVFMLREFKKRLHSSIPRRLLVATPAYVTAELDIRVFKEAIEMAFDKVFWKKYAVSAPIAAVAGLGYDVFDDSVAHCVVDVENEMSSVSLVCGGKLLAVNKCAEVGLIFNDKVIEYCKTNGLLIIEPSTALNAKELLPGGENECVVSCINLKTGVTEYRTFERNEVEYWFDSSYKKLVECFKECMEEKSITEKPIKYHLIGGASQTIGLKEYMENATNCSFSMPNEPDKVIIKGLDLLNTKPYIKHLSECGSLF